MTTYSASEVAARFGMTKDGLRYYEKEELLPPVARNDAGHRSYTEADVDWIYLIRCLRDTDMPISKIKHYVSVLMQGNYDSAQVRRDILAEHELFLVDKIKRSQSLLMLLRLKIDFLDGASATGTEDSIRCNDYAEEWDLFRVILKEGNL